MAATLTDMMSEIGRYPRSGYDVTYSGTSGEFNDISALPYDMQFPVMNGTYLGGGVADWTENRDQYVKQYEGSTYIAIGAIARMAAMQPVKVKRRVVKDSVVTYEPVSPTHPLVELLEFVNERDTLWDLWFHMVGWRLLTGDSFLFKAKNGFGKTKQLWPMPSQWVHIIASETEVIQGYQVRSNSGMDFYCPKDQMIQIRNPSLDWSDNGRYYGHPAIKASRQSIDLEKQMWNRLYYQFKNMAPPGMVLSTEMRLQPHQARQLWATIATQYADQTASGRPMVLHSGMKLEGEFSKPGSRELDYKGSLDKVLEQTMATHGVPKALVGLVEGLSRSNLESALFQFAKTTLDPILVHFSQHLTQDLAREFGDDLIITLGPASIDSQDALRKDLELMIKAGATTPDEVRHVIRELPPLPDGLGEKPVMISGFQTVDDPNNPDRTTVGRSNLAPSNSATSAKRTVDDES